MARARRRNAAGSPRYRALVEILERRLAARRQRLLLQPLRRAGRGHPVQGRDLRPQGLFPPAGHAAIDRPARLRTPRSQGLEPQRIRDGGRPLSADRGEPRDRSRQPGVRAGSGGRRRRRRAATRRRRPLFVSRQRRRDVLFPDDEGCAARAHRRGRSARSRAPRNRRRIGRRARRRGLLRRSHRRVVLARRPRLRRRLCARRDAAR